MSKTNGNNYNPFIKAELSKSFKDLTLEARGSLANQAVRGVEHINQAGYAVDPSAILSALEKYHQHIQPVAEQIEPMIVAVASQNEPVEQKATVVKSVPEESVAEPMTAQQIVDAEAQPTKQTIEELYGTAA